MGRAEDMAQVVNVKFDNHMEIVFVNGVPWTYDMLLRMQQTAQANPEFFKERRLDEDGRLVRVTTGTGGKEVRFSRDVGLDGQVEPMPHAPATEPPEPVL